MHQTSLNVKKSQTLENALRKTRFKKKFFFTLLVSSNVFASLSYASEIETVSVTAIRQESSLLELAGNTAVISGETLKLNAHTHLQESLVRVAGANFARGNGQEYLPAIRSPVLTGAGACGGVLTSLDGIPLRASGFCNINELFEANTEQAQRIEVIRGPGSALQGSNAVHGIVNIISGDINEDAASALKIELGPNDYNRALYSTQYKREKHGFRADVNLASDGGYRDDSGFDQQKLSLKHQYSDDKLVVTSVFSGSNLNQETAGFVVGTDAYRDDALRTTNPNPEAYRDAKSARFYSRIEYHFDTDSHLTVTPYARYTDMAFLQHFLPGTPLETNGQKSVGLQSAYYHSPTEKWELISGVDFEFTDAFLKQEQDQPTQGSAFLQATIPVGRHYDYQVDAVSTAAFLHANYQASQKLLVSMGLRYETIKYDYDNRMLDGRTDEFGNACSFGGCRYSRPADRSDTFDHFSPKLGLVYSFNENTATFVNLAHGFRPPQATELYRLQRNQQVAELDSEEVQSVEVGLRSFKENLSYEVSIYSMIKDNVIFRDADFFNVSDGKTRHSGIEITTRYQISDQFYTSLAATYARHTYESDQILSGININGNDIDSAPRHFGSAQFGWAPDDSKRVELEWLHRAEEYTNPENLFRYEGHDLLNLRANWQLHTNIAISAQITNLTDNAYAERADFSNFSGERFFPGEPRSYRFGLEIEW